MAKLFKRSLLILIIMLIIYVPTTSAFLDWLFDAINQISDALDQLELLTVIRDFQEIQKDLAVKWDEIKELQEDISHAFNIGKRWYYFETSINNQNILGNLNSFFNGSVYDDYNRLINLSFGQSGTIRSNPEYYKTMERIVKLYGAPDNNNYQNLDSEQYVLYNQLIAATDNTNAAGNMDAYVSSMIGHFQEWEIDTKAISGKEYVSQEALLKSLLKYQLIMVDYYKLSIQYMSSQLRYNSAQSIERYFDRSVEMNNTKRNSFNYGQSSNTFMNYLVSEAGENQ